jgi:DNA-directed RNA polymerase specialized sigma24 family protein
MQLWAAWILTSFGVRGDHAAVLVLRLYEQVTAQWETFKPAPELFALTARRRWISNLLLHRAAEYGRAVFQQGPRELDAAIRSAAASTPPPEELLPVREMLGWLEDWTTAERWRVWLACEIDGMPIAEIGRQEGCSPVRVQRVLERARTDLQTAFSQEVSLRRSAFAPRARRRR